MSQEYSSELTFESLERLKDQPENSCYLNIIVSMSIYTVFTFDLMFWLVRRLYIAAHKFLWVI